jgi:hypothetical protein
MLRYLRIAVSAACLIACVLLTTLWVRSYWWFDSLDTGKTPVGWSVDTFQGQFPIQRQQLSSNPYWDFRSDPVLVKHTDEGPSFLGFYLDGSLSDWVVFVPFWFPVLVTAILGILAALPWIRWRFSLRTLFVTTTLVGTLPGTLIYAVK